MVKLLDPNLGSPASLRTDELNDDDDATANDDEETNDIRRITMTILIAKILQLATYEAKSAPKQSVKVCSLL